MLDKFKEIGNKYGFRVIEHSQTPGVFIFLADNVMPLRERSACGGLIDKNNPEASALKMLKYIALENLKDIEKQA
jgi:hypothetical protein